MGLSFQILNVCVTGQCVPALMCLQQVLCYINNCAVPRLYVPGVSVCGTEQIAPALTECLIKLI